MDLAEPRLIVGAIADALQLPRSPHTEPLEQVALALARQPCLLILDNFERLAAGGAPIVWTLLTHVPTLTCLVTSRRRLHLPGEHEFVVGPLPTPPQGNADEELPPRERLAAVASVQLFVDRAQAARPDFQLTPRNAPAVAALCRALEGIPLALELAAARSTTLTPAQMLDRLSERFSLLANQGRRRDGAGSDDPRHHSLWAALDWSFHLLPPPVRAFFARLSVFRGGWSLSAAEAVCEEPQDALEYLAQLRAHSLLLAEESGAPAADLRFRMLETLREFAGEQLSPEQRAALSARHAAYFLDLAEQAEPKLHGPEQIAILDRLEAEHDNLRAALTWSRDAGGDDETHLRLAGALFWFWQLRSHLREGRDWLEGALEQAAAQETMRARATALQGAGQLAHYQGDYAGSCSRLEASATLWRKMDDARGLAYALIYLGGSLGDQADHAGARAVLQESVALWRESGDAWGLAMALWMLGTQTLFGGDPGAARAPLEESVALFRNVGDRWGLGGPLFYLGKIAVNRGDNAAARSLFEELLGRMRDVGDRWRTGAALFMLGQVALAEGEHGQAEALYKEGLTLSLDAGGKWSAASALEGLAHLATAEEQHQECAGRAAHLFGAAEALRESINLPVSQDEQGQYEQNVAVARAALSQSAFAAAWNAGRAMTWEQAVAYALNEGRK